MNNGNEIVTLVRNLYDKGKDVSFVINFLFENNVYYMPAIYIVGEVYKIEDSTIEKLFYEHKGYKESMNKINPFNEDFINFVDGSE